MQFVVLQTPRAPGYNWASSLDHNNNSAAPPFGRAFCRDFGFCCIEHRKQNNNKIKTLFGNVMRGQGFRQHYGVLCSTCLPRSSADFFSLHPHSHAPPQSILLVFVVVDYGLWMLLFDFFLCMSSYLYRGASTDRYPAHSVFVLISFCVDSLHSNFGFGEGEELREIRVSSVEHTCIFLMSI